MKDLIYRELTQKDCVKMNHMNPTQYVGKAYRLVDGVRQLVDINYLDSDWPEGYENHYNRLQETIQTNGFAIGAFLGDRLVGFASLNRNEFGSNYKYVLLDQLFITLEHRNKGIGKALFNKCADVAKKWNADKIYICAGSAEETIHFYYAIGCIDALEVNQAFYESDPRDLQLEYAL